MKNNHLWIQIQSFELDEPTDVYGFSLRLAKENFWTRDFTLRAILEYKRFMYLAAVSDFMVSPSIIIDQVWHLHLIYTKSYDSLCELIGKKIQHIPATHNPDEGSRYSDARQRTNEVYQLEFGVAPTEIWKTRSMLDSMNLSKSRFKLRSIIIFGMLLLLVLAVPFYFLLRPLYIQIENPNFVILYLIIFFIITLLIETFNRISLNRLFTEFDTESFVNRFTAHELIYLQYGRIESVVNGYINHLVKHGHIIIEKDQNIEIGEKLESTSLEEVQIIQLLSSDGKTTYSKFINKILARAVFANLALTLDAFSKYFRKSKKFQKLFYVNFTTYGILCLLAFERIVTGVLRDKPIVIITIVTLLAFFVAAIQLYRFSRQMFTQTIPDTYERRIKSNSILRAHWEWQYFLSGSAVFMLAFAAMAKMTFVEKMHANLPNSSGHGGGPSSGGSCGSSCGSSCGGGSCGGCGGD